MNRKFSRIKAAGSAALAALLLFVSPQVANPAPVDNDIIRVGLTRFLKSVQQLTITCPDGLYASSSKDAQSLLTLQGDSPLAAQVLNTGISIKGPDGTALSAGASLYVRSHSDNAILEISSPGQKNRKYRGAFEINFKSGALQVINVVKIDDYLMGVVPVEMPANYPEEALKAQAVAARTYALKDKNKHLSSGFDLCDTTHCQVYDGVAAEKSRSTQAVTDTRRMVLTYNNELASTMYSADCGGATRDYSEICPNGNFPYLCGVIDPDDIPRTCWEKTYSISEMQNELVKAGIQEAKELQKLSVSRVSDSGRVASVDIISGDATKTISSEKLRSVLGADAIKSTLFTIECSTDTITFKGKGWGHGIGLCQTGAKYLATAPHNYTFEQILTHYFPGTSITLINDTASLGAGPKQKEPLKPVAAAKTTAEQGNHDQSKSGVMLDVRVKAPNSL